MLGPCLATFDGGSVGIGGMPGTGESVELKAFRLFGQGSAHRLVPVLNGIAQGRPAGKEKRSHVTVEGEPWTYLGFEEGSKGLARLLALRYRRSAGKRPAQGRGRRSPTFGGRRWALAQPGGDSCRELSLGSGGP